MNITCPFCTINPAVEILDNTPAALAILDFFPVNPGHTLIIPRYRGDVEQPRGGVRGVIPGKQSY